MSNGSLATMTLMLMVFAYLKLRKTKGAAAALIFALVLGTGGLITEMRPAVADAQSCGNCDRAANAKPTITVTKALAGAGRVIGTDQFTVQLFQAGNPVNNSANSTTTGAGAVVGAGSGTTGAFVATAGTAYTLGETISGAGASLSNYTISVSCTNATAGGTNVSGITTLGGTLTPALGDVISCTITNTPRSQPTITVTKALAGAGRFTGTDQFTVQIRQAGNPVNNNANSTTTGAGAAVGAGSGTTGVFVATAGTAYTLGETISGAGALLSNYTSSVSCTNAASGGTNVSAITTLAASTLAPALGDVISCTITNTPRSQPTITVTKALAGAGRVTSTDQFTVQVLQAGNPVNNSANSTTTGAGAVVDAGSGTTGVFVATAGTAYTLGETISGAGALLSNYTSSVSCTNANAGGTNVSAITTLADTLTPAAEDVISCTITNTPTPEPTITVSSLLAGTGRFDNTDQFTPQIMQGASVLATGTATTGTGTLIDAGTGGINTFTATAGLPYQLKHAFSGANAAFAVYYPTLSCTNATAGGTDVSGVTTANTPMTLALGDAVSCVITSTASGAISVLRQISVIAPPDFIALPYTVSYTGNNGFTSTSITNSNFFEYVAAAAQPLAATNTLTTLVGTSPDPTFVVNRIQCTDLRAPDSGNPTGVLPGTTAVISGTTTTLTIPAAVVKPGAALSCSIRVSP